MKNLVSINIPVYNRLDLTERCIDAIKGYTEYPNYELVIIDDGSTDVSLKAYVEQVADRLIVHETNMGIAQSRHDGILESRGKYICELDSDVVVTPGWLGKLLESLEDDWDGHHQNVIVSALLSLQIGYFIAAEEAKDCINTFGFIQVGEVGTGCMVFRKSLIDVIGNFDPELFNLWSDKDFCYRVTKYIDRFPKPSHIVIDPKVMVYHHGWVDPVTGDWDIDTSQNTRSLPELNDREHKVRALKSMRLIKGRWGVEHSYMKQLEIELNTIVR